MAILTCTKCECSIGELFSVLDAGERWWARYEKEMHRVHNCGTHHIHPQPDRATKRRWKEEATTTTGDTRK